MVVVSRSVHIAAPVGRVFDLMADPARRARLNPSQRFVDAEIETDGPLSLGSVCHFRLQTGGRLIEYRTRVRAFERDKLIVSESDSAVKFEIRVETAHEDGGTRLTQTELFEPTDDMLRQALEGSAEQRLVQIAYRFYLFFDGDAAMALRRRQELMLTRKLERNMERWLEAIKGHLESGDGGAR